MPGHDRQPHARGLLRYEKPALRVDQLVQRLAERGLRVPDRGRAARYIRHIGYFRLSPYTIPFQQGHSDHAFVEGSDFDDVLDLYVFDRSLRLLVLDALERVEVAVRAAITDHMATTYEDPHWYVDGAHFRDRRKHARFLTIVREMSERRLSGKREVTGIRSERAGEDPNGPAVIYRSALEHYLLTYEHPELPPSWLMIETLTIGQLESVVTNLRRRADRTAIARSIGLNEPVLTSWLRT